MAIRTYARPLDRRRGGNAVARYFAATSARLAAAQASEDFSAEGGPFRLNPQQHLVPAADGQWCADLLHHRACSSIEPRSLARALEFAFNSGDAAGCANQALRRAAIAKSDFIADAFAPCLFLEDLVEKHLRFFVEGRHYPLDKAHLVRLLSQPPQDLRDTSFRQQVHQELSSSPALRKGIEAVYVKLMGLIRLFEESGRHGRFDLPRFRLDVLLAIRAIISALNEPFAQATSGLVRLHSFAEQVSQSQGYEDLCSLLSFENDLAQVDLHVQIGVDGRIRHLEVRRMHETIQRPFYRSPLQRFLGRVLMWIRGYRVYDTDLVERWFDQVYAGIADVLPALLQLRGDLEFYLAAQHFRMQAEVAGLSVCLPDLSVHRTADKQKALLGLFNPLLLAQEKPPVPCDITVDSFERICIVTGPNSGGKTRLLQALGIAQVFAQSGFYVPARSANLRAASGLFASLGEETSADQAEGRLGTELVRIRRLFERAKPGSLVILDELCSGTNPSEGEEIFHLVIELIRHLRPEVFITTHFLKFAAELSQQGDQLGLTFLQVDLDANEKPTYQFVSGVATTSLAHRTAERLGVTRQELISLLKSNGAFADNSDERSSE